MHRAGSSIVRRRPGLVLLDAPVATDNGKTITGWITPGPWFIPSKKSGLVQLGVRRVHADLSAARSEWNPTYRLTERPTIVAAPTLIPRSDWQFARVADGKTVVDPNWVTMKGGFKPGMVYQLAYESSNPPVAGVGSAAVRDFAAAVKNDPNNIVPVHGQYVYTDGGSQVGRWQRQLVLKASRSTSRGGRRWTRSSSTLARRPGWSSTERTLGTGQRSGSDTGRTKFPILYETTTDPVTGDDSLGARIPAGLEPKIIYQDTESEMYDRGRNATLRTISMDGRQDVADAPNVRIFVMAGAKHGPGSWPPANLDSQQLRVDPFDYRWAQRALLESLDNWVRQGGAAFELESHALDHTAIEPGDQVPRFRRRPVALSRAGGMRDDLPAGPRRCSRSFAAGRQRRQRDLRAAPARAIRAARRLWRLGVPQRSAGRAKHPRLNGWIVHSRFLPRRKLIARRTTIRACPLRSAMSSRDDYVRHVQAAADALVKGRYMRAEDGKSVVDNAGKAWDWTMSTLTSRTSN